MRKSYINPFQPFLRFWGAQDIASGRVGLGAVSTLLEILGLVWLVLVGF